MPNNCNRDPTITSTMSTRNLPKDILTEILIRLPIKSLTRFKSVSKLWKSLISSRHFIKSHLTRTTQNPLNNSLIVHSLSDGSRDDIITLFRIDFLETPISLVTDFPETFFKMELVGSINGLVCLCDRSLGFMVVLWNPATRRCKIVPFLSKERHADMVFVGFGYDSVSNDFKIVCIFRFKVKGETFPRLYVYSCDADSWNEIKPDFPINVQQMWCVATVKGVPYWMGYTMEENDENSIREFCVYFDVQNEVFRFLNLPEYESNSATGACLVNLNDSLADLMYSPGVDPNKLVDVYILDENSGVWSKIYTVGPIPLEVQRVVHCFKNGEIVIEDDKGKLVLYDPKGKGIKYLRIDKALKNSHKAFSYTESLVAINGMKHIGEEDGQGSTPNIRKRDDFLSKGFKLKL